MTLDTINAFLSNYSIDNATDFEPLPITTSGNNSYILRVTDDQYVIRTLVRQSPAGAEDERIIQEQLGIAGIVAPLYLKTTDGEIVSSLDDRPAVISKHIIGTRQQTYTLALAHSMGKTLALIHTTLHDIELRPNEQQWFNLYNARLQLVQYRGPDKVYIAQKTEEYASILKTDLPRAVTHGDFHTNNIFSKDDAVTAVFDFESAEYTIRLLDIARSYLTYRKVTDLDPAAISEAIITGYDSTIQFGLTEQECSELNNAFIYVALVSCVSIFNHGNTSSSAAYLEIAKSLVTNK